ncbi:hypothetical protein BCR41DRAFT_241926 [Lobosporangium transversale]|uniref:Uncharacterized protein n=1 Tax=Lobosporangium transversale TaxID=64571 RepID=A0A1Y2G5C9_9FUNG|nr:hypothetical protein BCR41DRAFT_241926 [Lobosporangium transversale]ORY95093.1 hypothetical protein BCR41DRAFT_241926 [Lobosporangium transversale]|eukprot:XP_021875302.1 hypothetical protein BCR41DRAFT_241926 [Lobosporangium transversale]
MMREEVDAIHNLCFWSILLCCICKECRFAFFFKIFSLPLSNNVHNPFFPPVALISCLRLFFQINFKKNTLLTIFAVVILCAYHVDVVRCLCSPPGA